MEFKNLCVLDAVIEKLVTEYGNDRITKLWYEAKREYISVKSRRQKRELSKLDYELKHMIYRFNDCLFLKESIYDMPNLIECLIKFHAAAAANGLAKLKGRLDTYAGVEIVDLAEKIQIAYDKERENVLHLQKEVQNDL